ncbi:MAG: hypothetical protein HQK55_01175 [Deltaproteobacteria bacterium]|nr:hypothetical protein [Deltaproteobacteria bacterium]
MSSYTPNIKLRRIILAALIQSPLYFSMTLRQRLDLVRFLCLNWPSPENT